MAMEFWDAVSRGMDKLANKLDTLSESIQTQHTDTGFTIMDKDYCWEDLDYAGDVTMQRHVVSGECRIVDRYGQILNRGTQADMEQDMMRRAARAEAMRNMPNPPAGSYGTVPAYPSGSVTAPIDPEAAKYGYTAPQVVQPVQAQYGDIIGVVRRGGTYVHYGIYVSDTCIVHYNIPASKTIGHATVHATNLRNFLRDDAEYFVLDFPKPYQPPVALGGQETTSHINSYSEELARTLQQTYGYHLYSPEETVARARSRLGETSYNLFTNNCEHFAIWCKTGVSESLQVSGMLGSLLNNQHWQFRRPMFR